MTDNGLNRSHRREEEDGGDRVRTLAPDVAFGIVGSETRLAILDVLWGPGAPESMAFAELRSAVGIRDGSQFNYHLRKLVDGGFVAKVDGGYAIRQAGARVICSVLTGYLTDHPELEPFETTGECFVCDGSLTARYDDELFVVACAACGQHHTLGWFPPSALVGRTPEEALLAHEQVGKTVTALATAGICSVCNGPMERTVALDWADVPVSSPYLDRERDDPLGAWYVCEHCRAWVNVPPGEAVMDHPAVVGLYRDHGIDISTRPRWELPWTIDGSCFEVVSDEPCRVRVTVALEDDVRVLTLDGEFEVISVD